MTFRQYFLYGLLLFSPVYYAHAESSMLQVPAEYYRRISIAVADPNSVCSDNIDPYVSTLALTSKYEGSDDSRSDINDDAQAEYLESVATIRAMEKMAAEASDKFIKTGDLTVAQCFLNNLSAWAKAGALLSDDVNEVGQAVRKWFLAATGIAYLKIQSIRSDNGGMTQNEQVDRWFGHLARAVMSFYSDRPIEKVNNHDYWAAWAVMVTAVNLQDHDMYRWAMAKFDQALGQIDGDGYLENELARENKALEYHNFALQPLAMLAVFTTANGDNLFDSHDRALSRLTTRVVEGLQNPDIFAQRTGYTQDTEGLYTAYSLAWIVPFHKYFSMQWPSDLGLESFSKLTNSRLGGDLSWQFNVNLPTRPSDESAEAH
ncbi:alginate lyase family protein [Gynuella sunshinyii]|nr:alginate lyase family protein [Gynuella sunshinyii]